MARGEGFGDLTEFWSDGLPLPIKGKKYVVPEPDAKLGLYCQTLYSAGHAVAGALATGDDPADAAREMAKLNDDEETNLYIRILGPCYQAMIDDGVPWSMIRHAGVTAFIWIAIGEPSAKAFWQQRPLVPTASPPNRAEKRAAAKSTRSTSTRAATAAKMGSPSITRSRQTSSPNLSTAAKASRGKQSSPAGSSSKPTSRSSTASTSKTSTPSKRARGGG